MSALFDQIKSALDHCAAAWKTNDGAAVASGFTDDGTLINPFGHRADGRAAVAAMYTTYFGAMLARTATTFALGTVRAVGTEHAFVDTEQTITGPDGAVVLVCHLAALMRRDGDRWRFVDARPYVPAAIPS